MVCAFSLKATWLAVEPSFLTQLNDIHTVFSHQKNFAEYRKLMNTVTGPCAGLLVEIFFQTFSDGCCSLSWGSASRSYLSPWLYSHLCWTKSNSCEFCEGLLISVKTHHFFSPWFFSLASWNSLLCPKVAHKSSWLHFCWFTHHEWES